MAEIVHEYRINVDKAVADLRRVADATEKTEAQFRKTGQAANDSFLKGSDGAKRLEAELKRTPKTLAELELKLRNLRELLRDDTNIGTEGFKRVRAEIDKTQKQVDGLNGNLKKTGINFANIGRQILTAFGAVGAVFTFVNALKNAVQVSANFEKQMSTVRAISGATDEQMIRLEKSARALGASTRYTATQVGTLQEEFGRLGFSTEEILAATEATLNLATAAGSTLAESAEVAGATVRAFQLDASETVRVTDVMALSFSKSALNMERFRESIKLVAPIAKAANIPLETTTALLGQLADAGLSGSIAGTSLKNLLSRLSDENSELSKSLGMSVKNSDDLFEAFRRLKDANIDLTEATELTDERSKAAFITLIAGVDNVQALDAALRDATGSTKAMADIMDDNMSGALTRLSSAYEGFILELNQSNGILKSTFDGLATGISKVTESMKLAEGTSFKSLDLAIAMIFNTGKLNKAKEEAAKRTAELTKQRNLDNEEIQKALGFTHQEVVATESHTNSLKLLSEELKTLKEQFENAEIGGKDFYAIAERIEKKANELAAAMMLIDPEPIDEDTDSPQQAAFNSAMLYKEKREHEHYLERKRQREEFDAWFKGKIDAELQAELEKNERIAQADREAAEARIQLQQQQYDETLFYIGQIQQLFGQLSQAIMMGYDNELKALENSLEAGAISQQEYDRQRRQLERERARAQKEMALFEAILNTAAAVTSALAVGPPAGYILAALSAALGAVEIGIIASQPLPQFAEGGWVDGRGMIHGRSHAHGGVKMEAEGGEFIVNRVQSSKNAELIEAINKGVADAYIMRNWVAPAVDSALLNGWQDVGKSAELNNITAKLSDHNIIAAMDRNRSATVYGLKMLAEKIDKRQPKRGGYA